MPPRKKILEPGAEPIVKQKREKKTSKHKVVAVITPDGIQGTFQSDIRRPLIAHLPVHSSEIVFHDTQIKYDPNPPCQPEAFNAAEIDPFSNEATYENVPSPTKDLVKGTEANVDVEAVATKELVKEIKPKHTTVAAVAGPRPDYGKAIRIEYSSSKTQELPKETDISCFWCCENFSGRPCIIPSHVINDVWNVYGNFCTPQCAMAYLVNQSIDTHVRWERIALLNRLYSTFTRGRIYPAPSRETLQRFGGTVSSDEFRKICEVQRIRIDMHMPPMVSILASIDTKPIDFYETPLCTTFTPPVQKLSDEPNTLKLRRTKPLKDKESTLDACLNITMSY